MTLGRLHGTPMSLPATSVAVGAGVLLLGIGGFDAVAQPRAVKKLDGRLGRLAGAGDRSSRTIDQVAPSLEVLRTLTGEPAGPGE